MIYPTQPMSTGRQNTREAYHASGGTWYTRNGTVGAELCYTRSKTAVLGTLMFCLRSGGGKLVMSRDSYFSACISGFLYDAASIYDLSKYNTSACCVSLSRDRPRLIAQALSTPSQSLPTERSSYIYIFFTNHHHLGFFFVSFSIPIINI